MEQCGLHMYEITTKSLLTTISQYCRERMKTATVHLDYKQSMKRRYHVPLSFAETNQNNPIFQLFYQQNNLQITFHLVRNVFLVHFPYDLKSN